MIERILTLLLIEVLDKSTSNIYDEIDLTNK